LRVQSRHSDIPVANNYFIVVPILNPSANSTTFSCPFSIDWIVRVCCRPPGIKSKQLISYLHEVMFVITNYKVQHNLKYNIPCNFSNSSLLMLGVDLTFTHGKPSSYQDKDEKWKKA
jgi:hypothetical protein